MSDITDDNDGLVALDGVSINPDGILRELLRKIVFACEEGENNKAKSLLSNLTEETVHKLFTQTLERYKEISFRGTLFQYVISRGNSEMVEYLIGLDGHDLEYEVPPDLGTPLSYACLFDDVSAARLLLRRGADPNHGTATTTPLIRAACYSDQGMVKILLDRDADINLAPNKRYTKGTSLAFYLACLRGDLISAESFLAVIKDAEECPVSVEQMVLCQSLLGVRLIRNSVHLQTGLSLWRKALVWFNDLMKPRFGEADKNHMSQALLSLYLRESSRVQTGRAVEVNARELLERSLSRFPDFRLCVSPEDISDDVQADHHSVIIHETILMSCISEMTEWWATHGLSLFSSIRRLRLTDLSAEKKRLCLLLVLENALHIGQSIQILSVNCNILLPTIIGCKLHVTNPGYLMLLMDINIDAIQRTFQSWAVTDAETTCNERLDVMSKAYCSTAETMGTLAFLILCNEPSSSQMSHLAKLVHRFTELCKEIETSKPTICMEYAMLNTVLKNTLENNPLDLEDDDVDDQVDVTDKLLALFRSLLQCGVSPNVRDEEGNTVMFTALKMAEPHRSDTIEVLLAHGGHVDIANNAGRSPYTILNQLTDCRVHPLSCRTLKCRAASTISFYNIPYRRVLPRVLEEFVILHDTHTPTSPFT